MGSFFEFDCGCRWPISGPPPREGALPLMDVDLDHLPLTCRKTWEMLGRGRTKGVFQLESSLGRTYCTKLKPENAEHIGALGALLRPGCLRSLDEEGVSATEHYCLRKNGNEEVKPYHHAVDPLVEATYGQMIFQEQAMQIAQAVAGFNLSDADVLRRAIGKKKPEEMAKVKNMFLDGAGRCGIISDEQAQQLFGWIEKSERYSFNRCISHLEHIKRGNKGRYCVSDTPFTIGEMYRIRHDIEYAKVTGHEQLRRKWNRLGNYGKGQSMGADSRIRPNEILDIQPSGIQPVFTIRLMNGVSVSTTINHKFPTSRGELTVEDIMGDTAGLMLFTKGEYDSTPTKSYDFSVTSREDIEKLGGRSSGTGVFGPDNRWYTNGSYTEFRKNDIIIPRVCKKCGRATGRLELHHISGDRENSSLENLERLCVSCHKKAEYAAGRTKRGEKGYPHILVGIESIQPSGEVETYDVTMAAPNHNFVTGQGVVTCNSHAISYGLIGYDSAYLKAHWPVSFFTSWLHHAKEKSDPLTEISELVDEAKLFDVPVEPPDLFSSKPRFSTDGVVVTFGVCDVKGIGNTFISKFNSAIGVAQEAVGRPPETWTWLETLVHCLSVLPAGIVEKLIKVGAMRRFGMPRRLLAYQHSAVGALTEKEITWLRRQPLLADAELPDLLEALAKPKAEAGGVSNYKRGQVVAGWAALLHNPPMVLRDPPLETAAQEQDLLGVALTCCKVDACEASDANTTCREFSCGKSGVILMAVEVRDAREVKTKKGDSPGKKMAFLSVADGTGSVNDIVVFPTPWAAYGKLLQKGSTIMLLGKRDTKKGSLVVDRVFPLLTQPTF